MYTVYINIVDGYMYTVYMCDVNSVYIREILFVHLCLYNICNSIIYIHITYIQIYTCIGYNASTGVISYT